ncbi:major facilitator superfamily domain-containing protein [Lipomyces orientalis]|uniref:Major facilitator superfamily domain-containing protein n=1 Tax=Lipomyces orientalis TaxID=1233043 RepID=A0ACC3TM30_9ASCO
MFQLAHGKEPRTPQDSPSDASSIVSVTPPHHYVEKYVSAVECQTDVVPLRDPILLDDIDYSPSKYQIFMGRFWDTFKKPPKERAFVQRLDFYLLLYSMVSFIIKTLDSGNISNAFVSGMKEELALNQQERNLFSMTFDLGGLVGAIPSQFILIRIRPSIWLPSCEIVWSLLVMGMASSKCARDVYVFRFFIGMTQAVAYPGFSMVLGSWYLPEELAKRLSLYDGSYTIANMLAGYLQALVYATLNGKYGLSGWRWLFLIDGIIGIPLAIIGYFCIPDFPTTTRVFWLGVDHRKYAVARMAEAGRKPPRKLTWGRVWGWAKTWRPYGCVFPLVMFAISSTYSYFNLWLKSLEVYTVEQVNLIPTGGFALGLVSAYTLANLSDLTGRRCPWLLIAIFFRFLSSVLLAIWNVPFWIKMTAFFLPMAGEPTWALLTTWIQEVFQDDAELRGILPAVGGALASGVKAGLPLALFPTDQAPEYKFGYKVTTVIIFVEFWAVVFFWYMTKRELKQRKVVLNRFGLPVLHDECLAQISVDPVQLNFRRKRGE